MQPSGEFNDREGCWSGSGFVDQVLQQLRRLQNYCCYHPQLAPAQSRFYTLAMLCLESKNIYQTSHRAIATTISTSPILNPLVMTQNTPKHDERAESSSEKKNVTKGSFASILLWRLVLLGSVCILAFFFSCHHHRMSRSSRPVVTILSVGWMAAHQPQIESTGTSMIFVDQAERGTSQPGGGSNAMVHMESTSVSSTSDYAEKELRRTAISLQDLRAALERTEVELKEAPAAVFLETAEKVVSKASSFLVAEIRDRVQESSSAETAEAASGNAVKKVNVGRYIESMLRGESARSEMSRISSQTARSAAGATSMADMLDGLMEEVEVGPTTVTRAVPGTGRTVYIREYRNHPESQAAASSKKLEAGMTSEAAQEAGMTSESAQEDAAQSGPGWVIRRIPGWTGGKSVVNNPRDENIAVTFKIARAKV